MGCKLAKDQVIYLCACVEVGRISWYICAFSTHFQTSETVHYAFFCLLRRWLDFLVFSDKDDKTLGPVSQHLFLIICGTLKNPWHCSKREGRGVPGVMVYLIRAVTGLGGWGEIMYGRRRQPEAPSYADVRSHPLVPP